MKLQTLPVLFRCTDTSRVAWHLGSGLTKQRGPHLGSTGCRRRKAATGGTGARYYGSAARIAGWRVAPDPAGRSRFRRGDECERTGAGIDRNKAPTACHAKAERALRRRRRSDWTAFTLTGCCASRLFAGPTGPRDSSAGLGPPSSHRIAASCCIPAPGGDGIIFPPAEFRFPDGIGGSKQPACSKDRICRSQHTGAVNTIKLPRLHCGRIWRGPHA